MKITEEEKERLSAWLSQDCADDDKESLTDRECFGLLELISEELTRRSDDPDHDFEHGEIPKAIHQVDQTMAMVRDKLKETK